jgi:phage shock protein E
MTYYQRIPALLLLLLFGGLLSACGQAPDPTGEIQAAELQQRIAANQAPLILDVRSGDEFDAGHLPDATNIPHTDISKRLAELPADRGTEIVVHCHSGKRAAVAEATLSEAGFTNIRHLEGDFVGWQSAKLHLITE